MPQGDAASKQSCFIAMPVTTTKAHAELFGDPNHWTHVMEALFVPAVEAAGFEAWRPVAKGSHLIHAEIVRQLEQADMVLCDMSQNNPNVFFELGVRTSVNKPVALVRCDEGTPIPFDVSGINTHTYDPSLKAWNIDAEVDALAAHLRDAAESCAGENPMWKQFGLVLTAQEPASNVSREDAQLELLSEGLSNLRAEIRQLRRDQSPPHRIAEIDPETFMTRRVMEVDADSWIAQPVSAASDSVPASIQHATMNIARVAATHDVVADAEWLGDYHIRVTLLDSPPKPALDAFRAAVKNQIGSSGMKPSFRTLSNP